MSLKTLGATCRVSPPGCGPIYE